MVVAAGMTATLSSNAQTAGSLDTTFHTGMGFNDPDVLTISIQADGKLIVGGHFVKYNNVSNRYIVRLNADGSADPGFNTGDFVKSTLIDASAIQSDGKIIIAGESSSTANRLKGIARLNTDGSVDNTFDVGTGTDDDVYAVAIQSDGKVIIGGEFTSYNGTSVNRIARLNTDGSLDNSFTVGAWTANSQIRVLEIQPDGKILAGGKDVQHFGTDSIAGIARLNTDGSLDNTFKVFVGGRVSAIKVLPNDQIVIGGDFSAVGNDAGSPITAHNIARVNANGGVDPTFAVGFTEVNNDDEVKSILIQPDGKLIVAGQFMSYNNTTTANSIARLNADGSLDNTFSSGAGAQGQYPEINTAVLQPDGKIVIGGYFVGYDSVGVFAIARLNNTTGASSGIEKLSMSTNQVAVYPNPANEIVTLVISDNEQIETIHVYSMIGQNAAVNRNGKTLDVSKLPNGAYFVVIKTAKGASTAKFLKN